MTTKLSSYEDFFRLAFFGKDANETDQPFDYQKRLADEILPELMNVPTGAGKTAAVLGMWLWRRLKNPESVGRRLIYCLPMRTLVEQTYEVTENALENLQKAGLIEPNDFSVHILYGGDVSDDWDIYPERQQIIIGTQDLLLSRALNRGYAMNRFRWAFHFGLFNNDCQWVFDEVQLFGDGLATTAQLAAFRANAETFAAFGKSNSLWMSATLDKDWLRTVDFDAQVDELKLLELSEKDQENSRLKKRLNAVKLLRKAEVECRLPKGLADFVFQKHERGTQTLIVVNTVVRAQEVYAEIEKNYADAKKQAQKSSEPTLYEGETQMPEIHLLHSRFRPAERKQWQKILNEKVDEAGAGRIIVATQVIEAGVDISAKLLLTDIAPLPSLVQRFGRVNRTGEFDSSEIYWIDLPLTKNREKFAVTDLAKLDDKTLSEISKIVKPYEWEGTEKSRAILETIDSASPNDLRKIEYKEIYTPSHVLRRRDLIDLFDTTADLSGFDLDVSRFVRGGEERDVSVYWRKTVEENIKPVKGTKKELVKMFAPRREELCSVPIYDAKLFIDKVKKAWTFDALSGDWREIKSDNLRTGMIILLDAANGGYDKIGWNPKSKKVEIVPLESKKDENENLQDESFDDDVLTKYPSPLNKFFSYTQTLQAHSLEVRQAAIDILNKLKMPELFEFYEQIIFAAHHHDLGKAHPVFQATVQRNNENGKPNLAAPLAKAKSGGKHSRKKFRHELASALALLEMNRSDLEIYLAAAHHGKVRLSIRALPDETKPFELDENGVYKSLDKKYARGIWEEDELPETDLGDGVKVSEKTLNLDAIQLGKSADGRESWLERMITLRDTLGVFRLAYLEAIVRAADVQASAFPQDYKEKGEIENAK